MRVLAAGCATAARARAGPGVPAERDPRPDGGCFAIVIAGYRLRRATGVPWNQSDHAPDLLPVITIRYWSGRP
jgi:hypothetical protein